MPNKASTMIAAAVGNDIPAEEASLLKFRERFVAWAADDATRIAPDRQRLADIVDHTKAYIEKASVAWGQANLPVPRAVTDLAEMVEKYRAITESEAEISLSGVGNISAPAIESPTVRGALVRHGAEIVAVIDLARAAGRDRIAKLAADKSKREHQVRFWCSVPSVRASLVAFLALLDDPLLRTSSAAHSVAEGARTAMLYHHQTAKNDKKAAAVEAVEPLHILVGMWRTWEPILREVLSQQENQKAAA